MILCVRPYRRKKTKAYKHIKRLNCNFDPIFLEFVLTFNVVIYLFFFNKIYIFINIFRFYLFYLSFLLLSCDSKFIVFGLKMNEI